MPTTFRHGSRRLSLDLAAKDGELRAHVDGRELRIVARYLDGDTLLLEVDGRHHVVRLARRGRERFVAVGGECYHFVPEAADGGHAVAAALEPEIRAPMPGKILQVIVAAGARVEAGDGLLIVEAMKMENLLVAPAAGIVAEVRVDASQMVDGGQILVVLRYEAGDSA